MKATLFLLVFIAPLVLINAQDTLKADTPKVTKLSIGNTIELNSNHIKFIKIKEDSRCPSDVTCMWAGQVTAIIGFYEKGVLKEEKEFIFGAQAINPDAIEEIAKTKEKTIYGYNVSPYPSSKKAIPTEEYCLELLIQ
ncbi:hypothetical protein [Aquimarina mytili]|uniref:DUF4920 domain-containing protein n=1 Tax=Aquimarina mytili TaxID=874423 RepID=A0A936ZY48_9FLAO|nr:hypothetical protein [Aquimarina mytili]MBL0684030.1 hypothetical protein [Aquimarina mytili]